MNFSDLKTLRNEKTYSTISYPKIFVSAENTTDTSGPCNPKHIKEPSNGISHEMIEKRIKANLERTNIQIDPITKPIDPRKVGTQFLNGGNAYPTDTGEMFSQP